MIVQYIIGGIIILLALLFFIIGVYVVCQGEINGVIPIILGIIFMLAGVVVIKVKDGPIKQDVLNGKAIYQETQVIIGSDTVKTYDIIWKQKNY